MADPLYELRNVATKTFFTDLSARKDEYASVLEEVYDESFTDRGKRFTKYYRLLNQDFSDFPSEVILPFDGNFTIECYDLREKVTLENIQEEVLKVLDEKKVQIYVKYIVSNLNQIVKKIEALKFDNGIVAYRDTVAEKMKSCIRHLKETYLSLVQSEYQETPKVQWLGNVNQLGALFFDLWKGQKGTKNDPKQLRPLISVKGKKELMDFLIKNFVNRHGEPLSHTSFSDYLNSSEDKQMAKPTKNRIELSYK